MPVYLGWSVHRVFDGGIVRTTFATLGLVLGSLVGSTFIAGVLSGITRASGAG